MAYPSRRPEDFQIAIICALPLEYDAVALAFDEFWDENRVGRQGNAPGDYNRYKTGRIGRHSVVLLLLPNIGKASAAKATANLQSTYAGIKLVILTGICGGVPSLWVANELLLGDVVISKSIVQYDLGRQYPNEFAMKENVDETLGRPGRDIRSLIATFETRQGRIDLQRQVGQMLLQIQQEAAKYGERTLYQRPPLTEDLLFEPDYLHRHRDSYDCDCSDSRACETARNTLCEKLQCDREHVVPRKRLNTEHLEYDAVMADHPQILVGRVGSGDTVMKSGLDRDRIAAQHSLVAFEMEGAGVWDEIPCIVVKGVSDYADSHKSKIWQNFAAATAASTTKALLEYYIPTQRLTATRTWFLVPYNHNLDFIGRSGILDHIRQLFGHGQTQQPAAKPRSRVALHGLGGIGKTQIALAYVYWLRDACPDVSVFWVHASNVVRFRQAYFFIAQECEIPGCNDPKADVLSLVKAWLERNRGRWVMILDNADDTEVFFPTQPEQGASPDQENKESSYMGRYIPNCDHGSVLVTSRNKQAALRLTYGKRPVNVASMTDDEANQLFCAAFEGEPIDIEETTQLSSRLEHLPLALAQAASFIQENDISINTYIQLLDESDSALVDQLCQPFEAAGRDSEIPHAVTATWIVSFEQIKRRYTSASNVLSFISLFDRQAIPEDFVVQYYNIYEPEKLQKSATAEVIKSLGALTAFSFITKATDGTFDIHRLIQLVTRKWLVNECRLTEFAQKALKVLSVVYPYGQYETREVCSKYLPHAKAVLDHDGAYSEESNLSKASILHNMEAFFRYQGNWVTAEQHALQAVGLRATVLGEEHPETLSSLASLASTYRKQGRWKEAEELEVRVLGARKRLHGDEHPKTLTSIGNLASTYRNQGRWKEAEVLEIQVIHTSKRVLGEEHPDTLDSLASLATIYRKQGRWKKAEELETQVIHTSKKVLGEEHPNTITSMSNLASIYWKLDRWGEAERLDKQVLETSKRVLGEEHPDTLICMGNLASIYWKQNRWKEAEGLEVQVMEARKRILGEEHPNTLASIDNLASIYQDQGRWKEAEVRGLQVVKASLRVLGEEHPSTLTSMRNLASTYQKQHRWKEAKGLDMKVVETSKRMLSEKHPDAMTRISNLAMTYWDLGRWEEAEELDLQVMETSKRVLGEKHPNTLTSMHNLAHTWKNQGRCEAATQLMRECFNLRQHCLGLAHPDTRSSCSALVEWEKN